jgi:hypothetical protein
MILTTWLYPTHMTKNTRLDVLHLSAGNSNLKIFKPVIKQVGEVGSCFPVTHRFKPIFC